MPRLPFFILVLALGASVFAQTPSVPPVTVPPATTPPAPAASPSPTPSPTPTPAPTPTPIISLAGVWAGSARLTTEGATPCKYTGPPSPPAARLEIAVTGDTGKGKLTLKLPAPSGGACPKLQSDAQVKEMKLTESTAAFRDEQGRDWNLALKEGTLKGIFSGPGGSGEVELQKTGEIVGGPGLGKGAIGIIAANVVGIGAIVGLNKALQDNSGGTTTVTCSPRQCFQISPLAGDPCDCSPTLSNVIAGGGCGKTTKGVALGGACALPDQPCESQLSCDNNVCQNPFPLGGFCPLI